MKPSNRSPSPLAFGAIGDAYGFCFEFAKPAFVAKYNNLSYRQHPEFSHVVPGVYSDDTQMQLALAELIMRGDAWTRENIAESFVRTYKRDPRPGYARGFRAFLDEIQSGAELLSRIRPDSDRNGAAMRSPVIGLLPKIETVVEYAKVQAAITHDTKGGIDSAVASALMCHFLTYDLGAKSELPEFLSAHVSGYDWRRAWFGKVPVHGMSTAYAALTVLMSSNSMSELLKRSIAFTGDVDSVATIALACASGSALFEDDISDELWRGLESAAFGLPTLKEVDAAVWSKVSSGSESSSNVTQETKPEPQVSAKNKPCVFFDRDGIINRPVAYYILSPNDFHVYPEFLEALRVATDKGYAAVVITNQKCVGLGQITEAGLGTIHDKLRRIVREAGLDLLDIYFCGDTEPSPRKKPAPGMLLEAAEAHGLDLTRSWMVGDSVRDVEAGKAAGCSTVLVQNDLFASLCPDADHSLSSIVDLPQFLNTHLTQETQP